MTSAAALQDWRLLRSLPIPQRRAHIRKLSPSQLLELRYAWDYWARDAQLIPEGDWDTCLILAGRGWGKTRTGAEWSIQMARRGPRERGALVGRTAADIRDVMVEGESGIMACSHPSWRPLYEPSKRRLTWPNGSVATCYSADEPRLLRGPQHSWAWPDELAAWGSGFEAWDQLQFGLRLGRHPQSLVTTTPRPLRVLRELKADPRTLVITGATFDNASNLAPGFLRRIRAKYEGTTLGRQELYAEMMDEMPGALWTRALIERDRVAEAPLIIRAVVAVDPAVTAEEDSNETGIIAAGLGQDEHVYILRDRSGVLSPDEWGTRAVMLHHSLKGDRVVAETNQGGDMVEATLRHVDPDVPYLGVHAKRGKHARAEPVSALYEQGRVHHVGCFPDLEDQLCGWVPGSKHRSPDRLDALVYAVTALSSRPGARLDPALLDLGGGKSRWSI
jgi:phage terminase large subunit-like protein